jgi:intraflagellar transport protein 172
MLLRHALDVVPGAPGGARVHATAYAPNGSRLAVAAGPERVTLYDGASHERRDKFSTKPADRGPYAVTALAFSADSTRLAVAQSDGIVFVYKLGAAWGDKKSICNKFPAPVAVTSVAWATGASAAGGSGHDDGGLGAPPPLAELLFGCADGSVRLGALRSNKSAVEYAHEAGSPVLSLAVTAGGRGVVSAHADGSVCAFQLRDSAIEPDGQLAAAALAAAAAAPPGTGSSPLGTLRRLAVHMAPVVAVACAAGGAVVAACADGVIRVYDEASGTVVAELPPPPPPPPSTAQSRTKHALLHADGLGNDDDDDTDGAAASSSSCFYHLVAPTGPIASAPDGAAVVVATRAGLRLLSLQPRGGGSASPEWVESAPSTLPSLRHLGAITSLAWHPAGASVVVGGATGGVEVYETVHRHVAAGAGVTVAFASPSLALVSKPAAGVRLRLQCRAGHAFEGALLPVGQRQLAAAPPPSSSTAGWRDGVLLRGRRYVALRTTASVMVVDVESGAATDLPARPSAAPGGAAAAGSAAGSLDDVRVLCGLHPLVCALYQDGALTFGTYGSSRPLGSVRVSSVSRQVVSVVVHTADDSNDAAVAGVTVACLRDPYTITTATLAAGDSSAPTATYAHSRRVAWVQLSDSGRHLLFRDGRDGLYVVALAQQLQQHQQQTVTPPYGAVPSAAPARSSTGAALLLEPAAFAGWVPGTDVAVAQRQRGEPLCVWYHLLASAASPVDVMTAAAGAGGGVAGSSVSTLLSFPGPVAHVDSRSGEAAAIRAAASDAALTADVLVTGARTGGGGVVAAGQVAIPLDAGLLSYYSALDGGEFARAAAILSTAAAAAPSAAPGGDTSGLWTGLCHAALAGGDAVTASAAAVAVGDPALMRAVRRAAKERDAAAAAAAARSSTSRSREDAEAAAAAARLAALVGGHPQEPAHDATAAWAATAARIEALQRYGRWEDAAAAADAAGKPDIGKLLRQRALALLVGDGGDGDAAVSGNEARAAALAEALGDAATAVRLHLAAGHAVRAAEVATQALSRQQRPSAASSATPPVPRALLEDVVHALHRHQAHAAAGPLLEHLGRPLEAVAAYVLTRAYRQAVELARRVAPDRVVALERAWGAALAAAGQHDAAVGHFVEAGDAAHAISAAIAGGQLARAAQLIQDAHGSVAGPTSGGVSAAGRACWCKLAAAARKSGAVRDAEAFYLRGGDASAAVTMHLTVPAAGVSAADGGAGKAPAAASAARLRAAALRSPAAAAVGATVSAAHAPSSYALAAAHAVAGAWLSAEATHDVFTAAAAAHVRAGRHDVADAVLLAVGDVDAAMEQQRASGRWDALVALTAAHAPHRLVDAHMEAAQALAAAGDAAGAERHFVDAGRWQAAAELYQSQGRWDDARRVARLGGGPDAANRVAIAQVRALVAAAGGGSGGGSTASVAASDLHAGITLLVDAGLVDARDWQLAVDTAEQHCSSEALPGALAHVAYRHGMALEDVGEFAAAEAEFLRAGRPREAVDMHVHVRDWAAARRVAAAYDPPALATVITAQAAAAAAGAEALYVEAGRPDLAVNAYLAAAAFSDALRVVRAHAPAQEASVAERIRRAMVGDATLPTSGDVVGAPLGDVDAAAAPVVGGAAGLARARTLESQWSYPQAVDAYLALLPSPDNSSGGGGGGGGGGGVGDGATAALSLAACEEAWLHAVRLASTHLPARLPAVADEVGERLAQLGPGKQTAAGDVYLSCAQALGVSAAAARYRARAVACYARGQAWERAYRAMTPSPAAVAGHPQPQPQQQHGVVAVDDRLRDAVLQGYTGALVRAGDADALLAMGPAGVEPALGVLAAQQRWDRLLQVAAAAGPPQLARYLYPHLDDRLRHGDAGGGWALLRQYGAPPHVGAEAVGTLSRLTHALFADRTLAGDARQPAGARANELGGARDVLATLVGQLRGAAAGGSGSAGGGSTAADPALVAALDRLTWAVHLSAWGVRYAAAGLADLAATAAVCRLRFADLLPPDQSLYVAAAACRDAPGRASEARLLMNRYLDVADAVDAALVVSPAPTAARAAAGWADFRALNDEDASLAGVLPPPGRLCATQAGAHYVADPAARRAAREWVVRASLDPAIMAAAAAGGSMAGAPCLRCGVTLPWPAAACGGCGTDFPCCVATGRPLQAGGGVACETCSGVADPAAAATVAAAFGVCAWCGTVVAPAAGVSLA